MNNVILIGRLARDPELRFTASGKAVATFSVAVKRGFNSSEADFFNIVVWEKMGENCANYLSKGKLVGIQGRLQSRSYETQSGDKRYITEIVANQVEFLESAGKASQFKPEKQGYNETSDINLDDFQAIEEEDDIPF